MVLEEPIVVWDVWICFSLRLQHLRKIKQHKIWSTTNHLNAATKETAFKFHHGTPWVPVLMQSFRCPNNQEKKSAEKPCKLPKSQSVRIENACKDVHIDETFNISDFLEILIGKWVTKITISSTSPLLPPEQKSKNITYSLHFLVQPRKNTKMDAGQT